MSPAASTPTHQPEPVAVTTANWRVSLLPASPYCVRYVVAENEIGFAFDCQSGEHAIGSDRRLSFKVRANTLAVRARGCDVFSSSRSGGEYLLLAGSDIASNREGSDIVDAGAIPIAHGLRKRLLAGADGLDCEPLVLRLIQRAGGLADAVETRAPDWITPNRLRRIDEMIDEGLAGGILVSDLSAALGLSAGHFSRAFRQTTGRTPREHIIECRLRRARRLIRTSPLPLAQIALECGFSSHSHMSTQFVARLGISPSALRPDRVD
ncbi:MAG: AraC family transcriptional regulator [Rhizobium sp.]|nr:MAG: AraC family transcriptional regulator [Rhizobium sp.]